MFRTILLAGAASLAVTGTAAAATGQQISVNGTGAASVPAGATDAQQQIAYDQALIAAVADAQSKAHSVAQQLSLTLGEVQSFTEQSDDYLGFCGVGFLPTVAAGSSSGAAAPVAATSANGHLSPIPARHRAKKKAHKSQSSDTCQVEADVTVTYAAG